MITTPRDIAALQALLGAELGPSDWYEVTQERINAFAGATEDLQWIHVDRDRAAASELGGTIAHGLYTLSLGPRFTEELLSLEHFAHALNYGFDRVRFPAPVPSGSPVRMRLVVSAVKEFDGGATLELTQTFEVRGAAKPVCVAVALARVVEHAGGG